jgi:hypothetical protein
MGTNAPAITGDQFIDFLDSLSDRQLGNLGFNLCAVAYIGLNLSIRNSTILYVPGSYLDPNWINLFSILLMVIGVFISTFGLARGKLMPSIFGLILAYSCAASLIERVLLL